MTARRLWPLLLLLALLAACYLAAPGGGLAQLPLAPPFLPPGSAHPLGTDDLGRDVLAALLQGGSTSLLVGLATALLAIFIGIAVGLAAGLGSSWIDEVLMRATDAVAALPVLLIAILVATLFGPSVTGLALVLGLTRWTTTARLVRAEALTLARADYVQAAIALGGHPAAIAWRHVLPQAMLPAWSGIGIVFGGAILAEAALGFVGLADPVRTSWGRLVADGAAHFETAWWIWAAPVAAITLSSALVALGTAEE